MIVPKALLGTALLLMAVLSAGLAAEPAEDKDGRVDRAGDPLPPRAVCRLGTLRLMHGGSVNAGVFAPDGHRFASVANDGSVVVWAWPSGKALHTFQFAVRLTPRLCFSPDGRYLAAHEFKTMEVWDLTEGKSVLRTAATQLPTFTPDASRVAWLKAPREVGIRDLGKAKDVPTDPPAVDVLALAYDAKGRLLTAEVDGPTLRLRELGAEKPLHEMDLRDDPPLWVQFTADATAFAYQTGKGGVRVLTPATGKALGTIAEPPVGFVPLKLSADGKRLAFVVKDHPTPKEVVTLQIWNVETGKQVCTMATNPGTSSGYCEANFSADGKLLALGCGNHPHAASFWNTTTGKQVEVFPGHREPISGIAFSPDGKELATNAGSRGDRLVRFWDIETGKPLRSFEPYAYSISQFAYTPDGKRLVTCGCPEWPKGELCVWDARTLAKLQSMTSQRVSWCHLAVSPDGERAATVYLSTTPCAMLVWDLKTGETLHTDRNVGSGNQGLAWLPGGRSLLVEDGSNLRVCDVSEAKGSGGRVVLYRYVSRTVALSPDGRVVALSGTKEKAGRLVELASGQEIAKLPDDAAGFAIAFAPDGRTVALSTVAGKIRLFDWPTGKETLSLDTLADRLRFSPDGSRLASVASGSVLIWDVADAVNRPRKPVKASTEEVKAWCSALTGADAAAAYRAAWSLADCPKDAVPGLQAQLEKVPAQRTAVARWIADLDDNEFKVRETAQAELIRAGGVAQEAVAAALKGDPTPEQKRRLETVWAKIRDLPVLPPAEETFAVRATLVLEQIGSPEARDLLKVWAKGDPKLPVTAAAAASLERLTKGRPAKP